MMGTYGILGILHIAGIKGIQQKEVNMMSASTGGKGTKGAPILTIRNQHFAEAPKFDQMIEEGDYVSYFESDIGDQWVFIRKSGADHATVYGGDIEWEGVKVSEHTTEQMRERLAAEIPEERAITRRLVSQLMNMADPLVPGLTLDESERTWLCDAWWTSTNRPSNQREQDEALDVIAHRIADRYAMPALKKHPNTTEYRAAMSALAVAVGREAGRRGMSDVATNTLLEKTLKALPK